MLQDIENDPGIPQIWDVTVAITGAGAVAPPMTAIVQFSSNDAKLPNANVVDVARKSVHSILPKTRLLTRM